MKLSIRNALMPLLAASFLIGGSLAAFGDDDDARDHELARRALVEGRIRPLADITTEFKSQFAGEILGVELEVKGKTGNSFIYEFKVLTPDGKLKEVDVDAKSAKIIKIEDDD